jgi:hypothetical protein
MWELHLLNIAKRELEYEIFLFNNEQTRINFQKQLEDIDERLAGEQIIAPFDGIIVYSLNSRIDAPINHWWRMFTIVDDSSIHFTVNAPMDVVRFGDVFPVSDRSGNITFDVRVASDPVVTNIRETMFSFTLVPADGASFMELMAAFDLSIVNMGTLNFTASPMAMNVQNALFIPRRAVIPEDRKSYVNVMEDGIIRKRFVQTGEVFGEDIQILAGLRPGETVVMVP